MQQQLLNTAVQVRQKGKTKFAERKGCLTGGAKFFNWWGNGRGWGGISPLLYMLKNALENRLDLRKKKNQRKIDKNILLHTFF